MPRKRQSPFEDLIDIASKMPWKFSATLALVSYLVLHAVAVGKPANPSGIGQMGNFVVKQMFVTLALFGQYLIPGGFLLGAVVSFVKDRKRAAGAGAQTNSVADSHLAALRSRYPNAFTSSQPVRTTPRAPVADTPPATTSCLAEMQSRISSLPGLQWSVAILRDIEWKRFEMVCSEYLRLVGFVATETTVGADGGVDIRIHKAGVENSAGIVQCKAWNSYKVGVKPVRELFGVMAAERISTGIFMTSGEFTAEAEEFARGKITLVNGEKLISQIRKLAAADQERLLDMALEGDYQTPTCLRCDVKMTLRESTHGRNAGGHFWGCVNYPKCKQTLSYTEA
jgi:restriction system protein